MHDVSGANEHEQIKYEAEKHQRRHKMSPNIYTFVMDHEQAAKDLLRRIKVDSITVSNVLVIFHVNWSLLIVPNERARLDQTL